MKVHELIAALSKADPDSEVVVDVEVPHSTIGGSPSAVVVHASSGFDWDNGTFRLNTGSNLVKFNDSQMREFNKMKKEASIVVRKAWEKIDNKLDFHERMEISKQPGFENEVHPLFKRNGE